MSQKCCLFFIEVIILQEPLIAYLTIQTTWELKQTATAKVTRTWENKRTNGKTIA